MRSRMSHRSKSAANVARPTRIESLENRRFLSSTVAADVLDAPPAVAAEAISVKADSLTTLAVSQPVKIEGSYVGHYVAAKFGKGTMSFHITHDTHTGHFTGTYSIN